MEKKNSIGENCNIKLLFHSSKKEYWSSILSRGLILPSEDPLQQMIPRTDIGKLGNGLYFSSDPKARFV